MSTARLTPRRTKLERRKAEVIGLIVLGYTDAQVARFYGTSREAVGKFRERHAEEIAGEQAKVAAAVSDFAIAEKRNRIADAQLRRDLLVAVMKSRAAGGSGYETGIVTRQYKRFGSGEDAETVEEYKVDTAFLAEWRENDRYVAEQLGQIPSTTKGIDLRGANVVIQRDVPELGI